MSDPNEEATRRHPILVYTYLYEKMVGKLNNGPPYLVPYIHSSPLVSCELEQALAWVKVWRDRSSQGVSSRHRYRYYRYFRPKLVASGPYTSSCSSVFKIRTFACWKNLIQFFISIMYGGYTDKI